jgi:hypothetical protein
VAATSRRYAVARRRRIRGTGQRLRRCAIERDRAGSPVNRHRISVPSRSLYAVARSNALTRAPQPRLLVRATLTSVRVKVYIGCSGGLRCGNGGWVCGFGRLEGRRRSG